MHLFLRTVAFLFCLAAALPGFCGKGLAQPAPQPAEWTIMVYMDGDNNLEHFALMDLLEMEQSIPENVHVIVLLDRHKGYSSVLGNWTGTRLYRVRRAAPFDMKQAASGQPVPLPENLASELLEDWGEADMADPATLIRFITAAARFPARRYALVPWNHGSGASINGMLSDEDGGRGVRGKGSMSISQFIEAAEKGAAALPGKRFDLLKYELCLMGQLDVMALTARVADYALASPPEEPAQGSDYLNILPLFRADISTEDLVRRMADINIKYYTELGRPAAFSAYKLAHMKEMTEAMRQLTGQLKGLAGARFRELTRATCFATHYENLLEDLTRGQNAMSSVELADWLDRLEREVPGVSADALKRLREASRRLVYHAAATPNLPECRGVTLYLPLRREYEHSAYRSTAFARDSGMAGYLSALYTAQDTLGDNKPKITNVVVGTPRLKPGRDGKSGADFDILPISHLTPFYRNVIRFDVTGTGILLTKLMQFDQHGTERRVCFEQLVTDTSDNKGRSDSGGSLFSEISPVYNDGTTTLMREFSVRYKVSNGSSLGDITITNVSATRDFAQNVSIGYGLYRDGTTGGQDLKVQVQFSNRMRIPLKMTAYETDSNGRIISMRGMMPRTDGVFRPAVTVLDANFRSRRTYGPPMPLSSGVFLLTVDMIDDGAMVGDIVVAETMSGAKAYAVSPVVPVRHNQEQVSLRENARQNGLGNLFGKYAMIELASFRKDPVLALPTFQTVEFHNTQPNFSFTARQGEKTSGSGLLNWMPLGLPQISLHKKSSLPGVPLGDTIQTWYAFLKGQGPERIWYCIGMGDGTRWALVPLEQYQEQFLEGVWISDTERWEFKGNSVQLTRDGHTGRGTFHLKEHILSATNMPADEYAVYLDREHGRMTLITRRGVASILTREGMARPSAVPGGGQAPQAAPPAAQALAGQWLSGPETGYARLSITPVPGTQFFNLRLVSQGQGETACTFAVSGQQLLATFRDNSRAVIRYALINNSLTLFFPNMPEIRFTRQ